MNGVGVARSEGAAAALRWHLPFLAGALPLLLGGFYASAVANRIAFAAWAVAAALAWFAVMRVGIARGWSGRQRLAIGLLTLAVALLALRGVVLVAGGELESGMVAVAPDRLRRLLVGGGSRLSVAVPLLVVAAALAELSHLRGVRR